MEKEEARAAVVRRIEQISLAKDPDAVHTAQLRLMGYMEALEDQGLLSEKEVWAFDEQANIAGDKRNAEWLASHRENKSS
ncbi:hypothetical protein UNDYM_5969 (plasmid) [Undibacterium sp. YM2]|uniref:hypothetical protein n=1 Tax=Undibacterium sp. YM2 TaxID=2058625 RepID=UPI001331D7DC|nr:hypothetical protein [Undibacterium sp. YM2]BBB70222.1 hypothetical protein UNDYM_5969 [Undibacterium sp. YM2]